MFKNLVYLIQWRAKLRFDRLVTNPSLIPISTIFSTFDCVGGAWTPQYPFSMRAAHVIRLLAHAFKNEKTFISSLNAENFSFLILLGFFCESQKIPKFALFQDFCLEWFQIFEIFEIVAPKIVQLSSRHFTIFVTLEKF